MGACGGKSLRCAIALDELSDLSGFLSLSLQWIDAVALGVVLVADIIVAATMVFILYRSRTGLKG